MSKQKQSKKPSKPMAQLVISQNEFIGVKFDGQAIEAVVLVAQGLLNLTEVFKTQDIHIDTLLSAKADGKAGPTVLFTTDGKKKK